MASMPLGGTRPGGRPACVRAEEEQAATRNHPGHAGESPERSLLGTQRRHVRRPCLQTRFRRGRPGGPVAGGVRPA